MTVPNQAKNADLLFFYGATLYASAVYNVAQCPSVCSFVTDGGPSKWLNVKSRK